MSPGKPKTGSYLGQAGSHRLSGTRCEASCSVFKSCQGVGHEQRDLIQPGRGHRPGGCAPGCEAEQITRNARAMGRVGFGGQIVFKDQPRLTESSHAGGEVSGPHDAARLWPCHGAETESPSQPGDDDPQIPQRDTQMANGAIMLVLVHAFGPAGGAGTRGVPQEARVVGRVRVL